MIDYKLRYINISNILFSLPMVLFYIYLYFAHFVFFLLSKILISKCLVYNSIHFQTDNIYLTLRDILYREELGN